MDSLSVSFGAALGVTTGLIIIFAILVGYLVSVYPLYYMYKTANLKNHKFALIPIIGEFKIYNLVNLSMWYFVIAMLVALIPIFGGIAVVIFSMYVNFKIAENFGLGTFGCILSVFFSLFVFWYIALAKKEFVGSIDSKYTV